MKSRKLKEEKKIDLYDLMLEINLEDFEVDAMLLSNLLRIISLQKNLNEINNSLKVTSLKASRDDLLKKKSICNQLIEDAVGTIDKVVITIGVAKFEKTYHVGLLEDKNDKLNIVKTLNEINSVGMDKVIKTLKKQNDGDNSTDNAEASSEV